MRCRLTSGFALKADADVDGALDGSSMDWPPSDDDPSVGSSTNRTLDSLACG